MALGRDKVGFNSSYKSRPADSRCSVRSRSLSQTLKKLRIKLKTTQCLYHLAGIWFSKTGSLIVELSSTLRMPISAQKSPQTFQMQSNLLRAAQAKNKALILISTPQLPLALSPPFSQHLLKPKQMLKVLLEKST